MASTSTLNLYFQLLIILILTLGLVFAKRKRLIQHGWLMLAVFILNLFSILVVMIPVAIALLTRTSGASFDLVTTLHALLGVVVIFLSLRILVNWRFRKPVESCFPLKGEMLRLYILWVAEVILGTALYYQLYV